MRVASVCLGLLLCLTAPFGEALAVTYTFADVPVPTGFTFSGINNTGQLVGTTSVNGQPTGTIVDTRTGQTTYFSYPGSTQTYATGINDLGQVVGTSPDSSSSNAFLRDPSTGAFTSIGQAGMPRLAPAGINNSDQILIGGVRDAAGNFTPIKGPSGTDNSYTPTAINNLGQVVGYLTGAQSFMFDSKTGAYTTIAFPGAVQTSAFGINDLDQVVGIYHLSSARGSPAFSYIFDEPSNTYTTLSDPVFTLFAADAINDAGQIFGTYARTDIPANGVFVATPQATAVPEARTLALLASGLAGLIAIRSRRSAT